MTGPRFERRSFLKGAGKAILAAPAFSLLGEARMAEALPGFRKEENKQAPAAAASPSAKISFNIRDYGATGDGTTKDTLAIQQTIERVSVFGGGEVVVPAGNYLTGALALRSNVVLRVEKDASLLGSPDMADYPLAQVRWEGHWIKGYIGFISAADAENIGITGPGRIVGSAAVRGRVDRKTHLRLPALLEFTNCRNVQVQDCYTKNYGMWSIHPTYCENVTFKNVTVDSGADGIDVDSCKHVVIDGCTFSTADDCISLKSGRGEEGNAIGRPTEDVQISNCTFTDSYFACIGIGSETSAGIRDVHVEHCKCLGARTYAIYLKSRVGRGAYIEDIYMNDLDVSGAKQGFLRLNFLNGGKKDENPVPGLAGIPSVGNLHFSNIHVTDCPVLVQATEIDLDKPVEGFSLVNVTGTCGQGISMANIKKTEIKNVNVTGFSGPLISIHNVTGSGLGGAATIEGPNPVPPIAAPSQPYRLH